MHHIFISHSSQDNSVALAFVEWLTREGWEDTFLDIDPKRGIQGGTRWQHELRKASHRCDLVICLASKAWIDSSYCRTEYLISEHLNKAVLFIIIDDLPLSALPTEYTATRQALTLVPQDNANKTDSITFHPDDLSRVKQALQLAGLDATFFDWPPAHDPERSPYPGLRALTEDDAGIFFGREARVLEMTETFRKLQKTTDSKLIHILGASGAGKSSFWRAGLWPRLAREKSRFILCPTLRPRDAALSGRDGLWWVLSTLFKDLPDRMTRSEIKEALEQTEPDWQTLLARLHAGWSTRQTSVSQTNAPAFVLAIDQAEELFHEDYKGEGARLQNLVAALLREPHYQSIVVFTIRADSFDQVANAPALKGFGDSVQFVLPPMPVGSYGDVIKQPLRRLAAAGRPVKVSESLVEALLTDIARDGSKDALPLLAFTLQRLMDDHGDKGEITREDYDRVGAFDGSIKAGVEAALQKASTDPRLPNDQHALLLLLRRGLIPWLAGMDLETRQPRRRVARMSEIPEEARALIELLVEERVLSSDRDDASGDTVIEPAHESLLRQWGTLKGWLNEDVAILAALDGVRRASRDWAANQRSADYLSHTGLRLLDAETAAGREDLASLLIKNDRAYLTESRLAADRASASADRAAAAEQARIRRRFIVMAASIPILFIVCGLFFFAWQTASTAQQETQSALAKEEKARALAEANNLITIAQEALAKNDHETSFRAALQAFEKTETRKTRSVLFRAYMDVPRSLTNAITKLDEEIWAVGFTYDGTLFAGARNALFVSEPASRRNGKISFRRLPILGPDGQPRKLDTIYLAPLKNGQLLTVEQDAVVATIEIGPSAAVVTPRYNGKSSNWFGPVERRGNRIILSNPDLIVLTCDFPRLRNCTEKPIKTDATIFRQAVLGPDGNVAMSLDSQTNNLEIHDLTSGKRSARIQVEPATGLTRGHDDNSVFLTTASGKIRHGRYDSDQKTETEFETGLGPISQPRLADSVSILSMICGVNSLTLCSFSTDSENLTDVAEPSVPGGRSSVRELARHSGHQEPIKGFAISPDRTAMVSMSLNNEVALWRPTLLKKQGKFDEYPHVSMRRDGKIPISDTLSAQIDADGDARQIRIFDWPDKILKKTIDVGYAMRPHVAAFPEHEVLAVPLAQRHLALVGFEGHVRILEGPYPRSDVWGVVRHPEKPIVYASFTNGAIHAWNVLTGASQGPIVRPEVAGAGSNGTSVLSVNVRSNQIVAAREDEHIVIYSLADGTPQEVLTLDAANSFSARFSPDGNLLAVLGSDSTLYIFKRTSEGFERSFKGPSIPIEYRLDALGRMRIPHYLEWVDDNQLAIFAKNEAYLVNIDPQAWIARARMITGSSE